MLSRSLRSVSVLRRAANQSAFKAVSAQFPKTLSVTSGFSHQLVHSFSTEKAAKPEDAPPAEEKKETAVAKYDYDEYDDYEEPKTAGGWVKLYTVLAMRLGLLGLGAVCVFFTAQELFPGRMSALSLFSEVFEKLQNHEEVMVMTGHNMKAFGRDVGRNTEGRRNHVDSYGYTAEDGSKRLRIRMNIKGEKGKVIVWAEVSDRMAANEYVYIICQNAKTGKVVTIEDNRDRLEMELQNNSGDVSGNLINKFFMGKKE